MRAEVVALRLEQVRGQDLAAVAVEERERGAEGRGGDAPEHGLRDDAPPAGLRLLDRVVEELVEEEGLEVTLLDEGRRDVAEEDGLGGTSAAVLIEFTVSARTLMMQPPRHILAMPA